MTSSPSDPIQRGRQVLAGEPEGHAVGIVTQGLHLACQWRLDEVRGFLQWLVLLLTLASGADYSRVWLATLINQRRQSAQ